MKCSVCGKEIDKSANQNFVVCDECDLQINKRIEENNSINNEKINNVEKINNKIVNKSKKKIIFFLMFILVVSIVFGIIIGIKDKSVKDKISSQEKENIWNFTLDKTINFDNITYNVSNEWETSNNLDNEDIKYYYYYPFESNDKGLFMFMINNIDSSASNIDLEAMAKGMVKKEKDIISLDKKIINNYNFGIINCYTYINDKKYEMLSYVFLYDGKIYSFSVSEMKKIDKDIKQTLEELVETVTVKQLLFENDEIRIIKNDSSKIDIIIEPKELEESVTYSVSDENIVIIEDNLIKGINNGEAIITAKTEDGLEDTMKVIVYTPVENIELNVLEMELNVGEKSDLIATITPNDASYEGINWKSSNSSIVTVDENGKIFAQSVGETEISASASNKNVSCKVIVKEKPIEFSGNGDTIISDINIPAGAYKVILTNNGSSNFIVEFYNSINDSYGDLLVNEIGNYSGSVILRDGKTSATSGGMLEITSSGNWNVKFEKISDTITSPISGEGDTVTGTFIGDGNRKIASFNNNGSSNFIVELYDMNGNRNLLVNEIGSYNGEKSFITKAGVKYYYVIY